MQTSASNKTTTRNHYYTHKKHDSIVILSTSSTTSATKLIVMHQTLVSFMSSDLSDSFWASNGGWTSWKLLWLQPIWVCPVTFAPPQVMIKWRFWQSCMCVQWYVHKIGPNQQSAKASFHRHSQLAWTSRKRGDTLYWILHCYHQALGRKSEGICSILSERLVIPYSAFTINFKECCTISG